MADVDTHKAKKIKGGFAASISLDKHERVARRSLQDIIIFYQAVEAEMQRMEAEEAKGNAIDSKLFARMTAVKEQYKRVMSGFLELDDNEQRHALITFSDTIQDLIKYIHMRKVA